MLTRVLLPICREVYRRVQHIQTSLCPESEKRAPDGQRGQNIRGAFKLNVSSSSFNFDASQPEILGGPEFGDSKFSNTDVHIGENYRDPSNPIQETLNQASLRSLTYFYIYLNVEG